MRSPVVRAGLSVQSRRFAGMDLVARAEKRRVDATGALDSKAQAALGQYFTPAAAAQLIASMPSLPQSGTLRILDPGAGSGALTAAIVQRIITEAPGLTVEATAVEVDESLHQHLSATLADCVSTASEHGVRVSTQLVSADFIGGGTLTSQWSPDERYDLVIMNPPYGKLGTSSPHRRALLSSGVDCPNLYAAFMALGAMLLREGGQLVAITPRSFANGVYFESFRRKLFGALTIDRLHTFESRSTVFADTGVLQENVILSATRGGVPTEVTLSASQGHTDAVSASALPYSAIIRPGDPHHFLRIPGTAGDTAIAETMANLPAMLADLGIKVSTGRVVDFRSRPNLCDADAPGAVPLIYPGNLRGGVIEWPRDIRKNQGFLPVDGGDKLLVPPGAYVAVKRFSAKEERRRIVAALWDPDLNGGSAIAFENHLNIFHCNGAGLDRDFAVGLSWWLNSSIVDQYFRTFSGHTQVNATDLRSLRYPSRADLLALGQSRSPVLPSQSEIDEAVAEVTSIVEDVA